MGECAASRTRSVLLGLALVVVSGSTSGAGAVEEPLWMPETLPALIHAVELGIQQSLTPLERAALSSETPDGFVAAYPELQDKIRRTFVRWTDLWVERALQDLDRLPGERIRRAERAAAGVDGRLRAYFESKGWSYRTPRVVFLPQRLLSEPAWPSAKLRGLYVLHYPDVLFASLDARSTLEHTLIHESLHFNKTGPGLGRALTEGIAEAAATELALRWELVRPAALRDANGYLAELAIVEHVLARMAAERPLAREQALEVLLDCYLTGDSTEMQAIFGAAAWSEVVRASHAGRRLRQTVKRSLGQSGARPLFQDTHALGRDPAARQPAWDNR